MKDRGVYRGLYSALPDDPDFQRLSPQARLVLYTLRVCKQAGPGVIFRYYPELLMAQTGLRYQAVETALQELERGVWIMREGVVVWVRNGLRYDPYMNLGNEKQRKGVLRSIEELPRLPIVLKFCDYYGLQHPFSLTPRETTETVKPFDTHSIGFPGLVSPSTDIRVPKKTDIRVPSAEHRAEAAPPPAAHGAPTNGIQFHTPEKIREALRRCPRLGAVPALDAPAFWQAELRANPGVDFPGELLKAEAYLTSHPERHYKRLSGFLHNWFARADRET